MSEKPKRKLPPFSVITEKRMAARLRLQDRLRALILSKSSMRAAKAKAPFAREIATLFLKGEPLAPQVTLRKLYIWCRRVGLLPHQILADSTVKKPNDAELVKAANLLIANGYTITISNYGPQANPRLIRTMSQITHARRKQSFRWRNHSARGINGSRDPFNAAEPTKPE